MITLHQFPGGYGLSSLSPFCTKTETYLRLARLEHRVVSDDGRRAPKGKLPYIDDDGTVVADSGFIIEHCRVTHGRDLDASLDERTRGIAHLVKRAVEEHLYFTLVFSRWIDDAGWEDQRRLLARMMPAPLRGIVPPILRRRVRRMLHAQGVGRHRREEIYALGVSDIDAIARLLGEQPFLFSDEPTSYDASVHAFIWHALATPSDNPLTRAVKRHDNLVAYVERVKERAGY